ncbi:MAG: prepilin-type N-terminal cleavage/methylation domain-containing protein [Candidatus Melainabacteria bacterium]|nr:prepilin-type N-terminal cleavage/methylation domain-containing protein [Candidatus Melainabacteria bacterium]
MRLSFNTGFTLTELLVGLGILGLIAAFAVPKVLTASGAALANAKVHKAAQAVVNGYEKWTQENGKNDTITLDQIMTMVQHNGRLTTGIMDDHPNSTDVFNCATNTTCYKMPDGAIIFFYTADGTFVGTSNNDAIHFLVDPDGRNTGVSSLSTSETGASVGFALYYNGRIRSRNNYRTNTQLQFDGAILTNLGAESDQDPTYYSQ